MLKRPSARRKSRSQEEIELPLVPIMDAFVTLIAFLLLATSLLSVTLIDTPVPLLSTLPSDSKEKPLTLTLKIAEDGLTLESPFNLIPTEKFPKVEKGYDIEKLHASLVAVKKKFLKETKLIFMPSGNIKYDDLVKLMDGSRKLEKTEETFFIPDGKGGTIASTDLFPDVIFGNVVSGN